MGFVSSFWMSVSTFTLSPFEPVAQDSLVWTSPWSLVWFYPQGIALYRSEVYLSANKSHTHLSQVKQVQTEIEREKERERKDACAGFVDTILYSVIFQINPLQWGLKGLYISLYSDQKEIPLNDSQCAADPHVRCSLKLWGQYLSFPLIPVSIWKVCLPWTYIAGPFQPHTP